MMTPYPTRLFSASQCSQSLHLNEGSVTGEALSESPDGKALHKRAISALSENIQQKESPKTTGPCQPGRLRRP